MASKSPPKTFQALFRTASAEVPLELKTVDTPSVVPGSVLLRILYAWIPQYAQEVLTNRSGVRGEFHFSGSVVGFTAVARVEVVPIDAAVLKVGDLVVYEPTIWSRDDPVETKFLQGWHPGMTPSCQKMADVWWTAAFGELMLAPLESVFRVDEKALEKTGTTVANLAFFGQFGTAYEGFRGVSLMAGETVLIAPATGTFGGAAIHVALAMGANVIAAGRRVEVLEELAALYPGRVDVFPLGANGTLDWMALLAKFGQVVDVFCDFTPAAAGNSELTKSGMMAVKGGGRVCLVGGAPVDVAFPYTVALWKGLTIKGSMMILPARVPELLRLIETGRLPLGGKAGFKTCGIYPLQEWKAALDNATKQAGPGKGTFFTPSLDG